ncbi:MAG: thioredoxin family protein [Spirochaetia bacterium]
MRTGLKRGLLLVVLSTALLVPPVYTQLNNLEVIESPSSNKGTTGSVSDSVSENQAAAPQADVQPQSEALVLDQAGTGSFTVTFFFPEGFHQTKQEEFFTVSAPDAAPLVVTNVNYPAGVHEEGIVNYYGSASLEVEVRARESISAGEYRVPFSASYQLCDEAGTCFFPQDETTRVTLQVPEDIAAGGAAAVAGPAASGAEVGLLTLLQYLLFALIGGLLLNVMPCVLPVLSIRALNLVKQSTNSRSEIFKGSLFYTLGVLASLLILAAVVIALKLSGELVGWGFQFQNPAFVVFLIVVVFVFALSLFDVYVFQAPTMNTAVQRASRKGYVGSFFNGIIAVLLATPCTAPLLGTTLGFAFSQPPYLIVSIFAMVGIGFALPFLLIGIKPALIHKLPKPGPWMNTFKELMGFVLLATAIYLLSILRFQITSEQMIQVLLFLLILGFLLWGYGKTATPAASRKRKWIILAVFIILSVSAAGRLLEFDSSPDTQKTATTGEGWEQFSADKLKEYRQTDTPVLVIFSAQWCTVCKLNEQTVLHTDQADRLFKTQDVQVLYGDYTNKNPVIEEWIRSYGRAGVPVYAYYPAGEEYTLLPEVLTFQILRKALSPSS